MSFSHTEEDITSMATASGRRARDEADKEKAVQLEMLVCRHFDGLGLDNAKCCKAGVNYRQLVGGPDLGWARKIPCTAKFKSSDPDPVPCEKMSRYTEAEALEIVERHDKAIKNTILAMNAAHDDAKAKGMNPGKPGKGGKDSLLCPVCKTGKLHYRVSGYNGHLWGQCSTANCVSWMQ